jgi:hypothetical protein
VDHACASHAAFHNGILFSGEYEFAGANTDCNAANALKWNGYDGDLAIPDSH